MKAPIGKISLVIPACNEEANVAELARRLSAILEANGGDWEIIFVDDGSRDRTLTALKALHLADRRVHYLSLARNFGHQFALKAGLDHADGDCVITLDADFQHPPELIPRLLEKWREGFDVVYTVRRDDPRLPIRKRLLSSLFYRVLNLLSDIRLEKGAADFRLLDRAVADVLRDLPEYHLFFRGLTAWVGFRQCAVPYVPDSRLSGESKYTLRRMVSFALTGITSFSLKPLRLSMMAGGFFALAAFLYGLYAVGMKLFTVRTVPGWSSILASILFIGGIQLIALGVIGEYLGRLIVESRRRPRYIVREASLDLDPARGGPALDGPGGPRRRTSP